MIPLPTKCPICGGGITVTRFHCDECDITIEGQFSPNTQTGPLAQLTPEQLQFVITFVKCEGKLNRMEGEMNLSYPTLRSRLQDVVRAMGYEPGRSDSDREEAAAARITDEDRKRILDDLDAGRIDAEQAMKMLQS